VVSPGASQALLGLSLLPPFEQFYLAGGTGLALHLGHRRSDDLDFFAGSPFAPDVLIEELQALPGFSVTAKAEATLHFLTRGTKVSVLGYPYPLLFPLETMDRVNVADIRDIACMKISALAGRATRRDFVDLYFATRDLALSDLLETFRRKFAQANYSYPHILKSLTYFEDAERDPIPEMLRHISWAEIREFFEKEAGRLL
jgi:hypothetical protein